MTAALYLSMKVILETGKKMKENLESDAEETELPDEEDDFEEDPRLVRHRCKKLAVRIILIIVGVLILAYLGAALLF